jgi:dihydrofolate synthase/folylpolyglutamate synthase
VDIGIIETGLGGRLDATNVARPLAGVITTIGLDHTELLGPTITHVAKEKGGIIKRNTPLVLGNIRRDAALVLREIARKRNARIFVAARTAAFAPRGTRGTVSFRTGLLRGTSVRPGLFGEFQAQNAALAAATMTVLDRIGVLRTSPEDLVRGLTDVVSLTGMRGRMEIVERPEGPYLLDVGHNPDGVGVFVNAVRRARIHPAVILFAAMADKDSTGMLKHLATLGVPIVMTRPGIPRAMSPDELTSRGNNLGLVCVTSDDVPTGMAMARAMAGRGLVVIMGSHYLVGEAIPLFVDR